MEHSHHGPSVLPTHPGNPNVNVDPRMDGRLPGPGRKPNTGTMTNPSEWTNKPDYQTKKPPTAGENYHSDWAAQESYAQIPGIPADRHLYFDYPELENFWSAEEGEVPEPYVAAAYVKWFVSGWKDAYRKPVNAGLDDSISIEDIAAALERRDQHLLKILSQCATDHHNVAEISRDSGPRPLSTGKYDTGSYGEYIKNGKKNKNASLVPYAIQHLVEIIPNTRSDTRLTKRAGVLNTKRLRALSHGAGAASSLAPKHPGRSKSVHDPKKKNAPEHVIHHVDEELDRISDGFARKAFRNGGELSDAIAKAVSRDSQRDYDGLPKYVGQPLERATNYRDYQYSQEFDIEGQRLNLYIDPAHDLIMDSVGTTLVEYKDGKTLLYFAGCPKVIIDETLDFHEAVAERHRLKRISHAIGSEAISSLITDYYATEFVESYGDLESKLPVFKRRSQEEPKIILGAPSNEQAHPSEIETGSVSLSNGETIKSFADGTLRLSDGKIIARWHTSRKPNEPTSTITEIFGPSGSTFIKGEAVSPLRVYKNYIFRNKSNLPGVDLNATWNIHVIEHPTTPDETKNPMEVRSARLAREIGLDETRPIRVRMLDGGPDIPDGRLVNYTYTDPTNPESIQYLVEFTGRNGNTQQTWVTPTKLRFWNPPKP